MQLVNTDLTKITIQPHQGTENGKYACVWKVRKWGQEQERMKSYLSGNLVAFARIRKIKRWKQYQHVTEIF